MISVSWAEALAIALVGALLGFLAVWPWLPPSGEEDLRACTEYLAVAERTAESDAEVYVQAVIQGFAIKRASFEQLVGKDYSEFAADIQKWCVTPLLLEYSLRADRLRGFGSCLDRFADLLDAWREQRGS